MDYKLGSGPGDEHHVLSTVNPGRLPSGEGWIYSRDDAVLLGIVLALADVIVWSSQSRLQSLINSHGGHEGPGRTAEGSDFRDVAEFLK